MIIAVTGNGNAALLHFFNLFPRQTDPHIAGIYKYRRCEAVFFEHRIHDAVGIGIAVVKGEYHRLNRHRFAVTDIVI